MPRIVRLRTSTGSVPRHDRRARGAADSAALSDRGLSGRGQLAGRALDDVEESAERRRGTTASGRSLLSRFDKDGDEALSEEETPEFLKPRFNRIDTDGDGLISADELRSIRGDSRPGPARPE